MAFLVSTVAGIFLTKSSDSDFSKYRKDIFYLPGKPVAILVRKFLDFLLTREADGASGKKTSGLFTY